MSFGSIFKTERERRGMTANQVADATHMMVQVVEELEAENFERIAAPIYGRGFVKIYANFLELDPAPLLREFERLYAEQEGVRKEKETQEAKRPIPMRAASPLRTRLEPSNPAETPTRPKTMFDDAGGGGNEELKIKNEKLGTTPALSNGIASGGESDAPAVDLFGEKVKEAPPPRRSRSEPQEAPKSLFEDDGSRPKYVPPPPMSSPKAEEKDGDAPALFDKDAAAIFATARRSPLLAIAAAIIVVVLAVCAVFLATRSKPSAEKGVEAMANTPRPETQQVAASPKPASLGMTMDQFAQPPAGYAD